MLDRLKAWLGDHLVDDASNWWRWFSTHILALISALTGFLATNSMELAAVLAFLPEELHSLGGAAIAVVLFVIGLIGRLFKQGEPIDVETSDSA
ncbi:MAG: hypothetical protein AAF494_00675 [Pseudomonadota bacterium]